MLKYDDVFNEFYHNYKGKLYDLEMEQFYNKEDYSDKEYEKLEASQRFLALPIKNLKFSNKIYDKYIQDYILKPYGRIPEVKKMVNEIYRESKESSWFQGKSDHLFNDMKLWNNFMDFYYKEMHKLVIQWLEDNEIPYIGNIKSK